MAGTTTNYAWTYPTSTDLVKDGATAIQTAIQGADTSLFSITSGKNVGLVHINTTTFTSGTSVQINNVFTSSFDNYLIQISNVKCSVAANTTLRLSVGGTPNTAASYLNGQIYWSAAVPTTITATDVWFPIGGAGTTDNTGMSSIVTLTNPAKALPTGFHSQAEGNSTSNIINGVHQVSTAYDGLNFFGGTFTSGTIRIFGYRNS
jgi:hypothetical protein